MAEEPKQVLRYWRWAGIAVVLVAVFLLSRRFTVDRIPVRAATATRSTLLSTVSTNGLVEPTRNYEFYSPLATSVEAVLVHQGDEVKAGQLLMRLVDVNARSRVASAESGLRGAQANLEALREGGSTSDRQTLASNLRRAQLDLAQARQELKALQMLEASGAASASEVSSSRQRELVAEEAVRAFEERQRVRYSPTEMERAQAAVNEAQTALDAARAVLAQTIISAPVAGTVYSVSVGASDFVEEGKLLLQMADLKQVRVRAYFDEPEIGRLAIGQKIRIVWDARPGREWHGHIVQVPSTIVSYGTRNVGEVLVAIDDADDGLLPETHVTVTVTTSSQANVLTVPREALHSESGKPYVYRIIDGKLAHTVVTTGTINLTQVEILSGLRDGDEVTTGSLNGMALEDTVPVKVVR
uniref:Secretion protein HlyD n=1 Tax=mine drainage metagenome TaxID=410659 RepID=E6QHZ7_9ZZZZ